MVLGPGLSSAGHLSQVTTNYVIPDTRERNSESVRKGEGKRDKSGNRIQARVRWSGSGHYVRDPPHWVLAAGVRSHIKLETFSSNVIDRPRTFCHKTKHVKCPAQHFPTLSLLSILTNHVWGLYGLCVWGLATTTRNSPLILPCINWWLCPLPFDPSSGLNEETPSFTFQMSDFRS